MPAARPDSFGSARRMCTPPTDSDGSRYIAGFSNVKKLVTAQGVLGLTSTTR